MYFNSVKDIIETYAIDKNIKPLSECRDTLSALMIEVKKDNPYMSTAENFEKYNNGLEEETDDWFFYKYLESLPNQNQYQFPVNEKEYIIVYVDLLNPYKSDLENKNIIHPRWHLLVCYYAYIDAAFNHHNDKYAKNIKGIKSDRLHKKFRCGSLKAWMRETDI